MNVNNCSTLWFSTFDVCYNFWKIQYPYFLQTFFCITARDGNVRTSKFYLWQMSRQSFFQNSRAFSIQIEIVSGRIRHSEQSIRMWSDEFIHNVTLSVNGEHIHIVKCFRMLFDCQSGRHSCAFTVHFDRYSFYYEPSRERFLTLEANCKQSDDIKNSNKCLVKMWTIKLVL